MILFGVINIIGLISAIAMAAPHVIFARRFSYDKTVFDNRAMLYIARLGRYASLFLMSFNVGVLENGFPNALMSRVWAVITVSLTIIYILLWFFFFKKQSRVLAALMLATAALNVILSGILQEKTLLLTAGIIYVAGEIYLLSKF